MRECSTDHKSQSLELRLYESKGHGFCVGQTHLHYFLLCGLQQIVKMLNFIYIFKTETIIPALYYSCELDFMLLKSVTQY